MPVHLSCAMRVLVIEDERRLAQNVARSLREVAGFAVDLAFDGEDGLFMAEANPYDLIILDLMLPAIDGLQLLERMRRDGHRIPVVVLTARDENEWVVGLTPGEPLQNATTRVPENIRSPHHGTRHSSTLDSRAALLNTLPVQQAK